MFLTPMAPSVQRDLGGPVVEGARHEDLLGRTGPPEDGGPGLSAGTLAVALQVLLPRQELLDLLRSLARRRTSSIHQQQMQRLLVDRLVHMLLASYGSKI